MVVTVAAALLLAGCAGTGKTDRTAEPASSPSAAAEQSPAAAAQTLDQVLSELHLASQDVGEGRARVLMDEERATQQLPTCRAAGMVLTRTVPGRAEILKITEQLRRTGWVIDDQDFIEATSGPWTIMFRPMPLPTELAAKESPNEGMIQLWVTGKCYRP
ncbi:hypothetical protein [Streptomyces griseoflavus]|uniref:Uncharacterized protein n=1 Tax=Streptomyces griseoflavus Tu4000 TaxID=467200 RepID=D9Y2A2_9ACTN|nr:hypothetical protein [Streptomyces griseoflavus]EFL37266.1 hypothetical protein SSRG_00070 [Streptomyces griseoflavus Tu4000]